MITSKVRGHLVTTETGEEWRYEDGEIYHGQDRPCTKCGAHMNFNDPDACLGRLPGVDYACCGHGDPHYEYVMAGGVRYDSLEKWSQATLG